MTFPQIPLWLIPSFYGDIRLTSTSPKTCVLLAEKLTPRERQALAILEPKARSKGWIEATTRFLEGETKIGAPIEKISKILAAALKPGRQVVSAVRFVDGTFEEVSSATFDDKPTPATDAKVTASAADPDPEVARTTEIVAGAARDAIALPEAKEKEKPKRERPAAAVGASVAAPVRGCPAPDFVNAEIKAAEVLCHFLTFEQRDDFVRHNRFISVGAETGRRYMITSRHAKDELARYQRSLFDLEDEAALCVHDWAVPAAEEMLSLHLLLQLPGWETYLRRDEHDFELLALERAALGDEHVNPLGPFGPLQ